MRRTQSGTYVCGRAPAELDARYEVELALTDLAINLEFLGQVVSGESEGAVKDAQNAMERVRESLRERGIVQAQFGAREAS